MATEPTKEPKVLLTVPIGGGDGMGDQTVGITFLDLGVVDPPDGKGGPARVIGFEVPASRGALHVPPQVFDSIHEAWLAETLTEYGETLADLAGALGVLAHRAGQRALVKLQKSSTLEPPRIVTP